MRDIPKQSLQPSLWLLKYKGTLEQQTDAAVYIQGLVGPWERSVEGIDWPAVQ